MGNSILIVSTNWIGDAIMSMPAIEIFRAENPDAKITVLTKPPLEALWEMHPAVDEIQRMEKPFATARRLKQISFSHAYIFPNSFRSAFVPFFAGIPKRTGARGKWRRLLLTETVAVPHGHQQFEYTNILGVQGDPPAPAISVPEKSIQTVKEILFQQCGADTPVCENGRQECLPHNSAGGNGRQECLPRDSAGETDRQEFLPRKPLITILPGAARGPAKRWPPENFAGVAKKLRSEFGAQIVLAGGAGDAGVCDEVAAAVGGGVINLAGKTTIPEWAALLKISNCVVSNDSGGMHLATAVGAPVVAVFGITDPAKTGPLGRAVVLQKSELRTRDVARNSEEAVRALAAVTPDDVFDAVAGVLSGE